MSDVQIVNNNGLFTFYLETEKAIIWVENNVDDLPFFGEQLVVDGYNYAWDIYQGMKEDGLVVE